MASDGNDDIFSNLLGGSGLAYRALNQAAVVAGNIADALTGVGGPYSSTIASSNPDSEWTTLHGEEHSVHPPISHTTSSVSALSPSPLRGGDTFPLVPSFTPARTASVPFGPPVWVTSSPFVPAALISSPLSITPGVDGTPAPTGPTKNVSESQPTTEDDLFAGLEVDPHIPSFPVHFADKTPSLLPEAPSTDLNRTLATSCTVLHNSLAMASPSGNEGLTIVPHLGRQALVPTTLATSPPPLHPRAAASWPDPAALLPLLDDEVNLFVNASTSATAVQAASTARVTGSSATSIVTAPDRGFDSGVNSTFPLLSLTPATTARDASGPPASASGEVSMLLDLITGSSDSGQEGDGHATAALPLTPISVIHVPEAALPVTTVPVRSTTGGSHPDGGVLGPISTGRVDARMKHAPRIGDSFEDLTRLAFSGVGSHALDGRALTGPAVMMESPPRPSPPPLPPPLPARVSLAEVPLPALSLLPLPKEAQGSDMGEDCGRELQPNQEPDSMVSSVLHISVAASRSASPAASHLNTMAQVTTAGEGLAPNASRRSCASPMQASQPQSEAPSQLCGQVLAAGPGSTGLGLRAAQWKDAIEVEGGEGPSGENIGGPGRCEEGAGGGTGLAWSVDPFVQESKASSDVNMAAGAVVREGVSTLATTSAAEAKAQEEVGTPAPVGPFLTALAGTEEAGIKQNRDAAVEQVDQVAPPASTVVEADRGTAPPAQGIARGAGKEAGDTAAEGVAAASDSRPLLDAAGVAAAVCPASGVAAYAARGELEGGTPAGLGPAWGIDTRMAVEVDLHDPGGSWAGIELAGEPLGQDAADDGVGDVSSMVMQGTSDGRDLWSGALDDSQATEAGEMRVPDMVICGALAATDAASTAAAASSGSPLLPVEVATAMVEASAAAVVESAPWPYDIHMAAQPSIDELSLLPTPRLPSSVDGDAVDCHEQEETDTDDATAALMPLNLFPTATTATATGLASSLHRDTQRQRGRRVRTVAVPLGPFTLLDLGDVDLEGQRQHVRGEGEDEQREATNLAAAASPQHDRSVETDGLSEKVAMMSAGSEAPTRAVSPLRDCPQTRRCEDPDSGDAEQPSISAVQGTARVPDVAQICHTSLRSHQDDMAPEADLGRGLVTCVGGAVTSMPRSETVEDLTSGCVDGYAAAVEGLAPGLSDLISPLRPAAAAAPEGLEDVSMIVETVIAGEVVARDILAATGAVAEDSSEVTGIPFIDAMGQGSLGAHKRLSASEEAAEEPSAAPKQDLDGGVLAADAATGGDEEGLIAEAVDTLDDMVEELLESVTPSVQEVVQVKDEVDHQQVEAGVVPAEEAVEGLEEYMEQRVEEAAEAVAVASSLNASAAITLAAADADPAALSGAVTAETIIHHREAVEELVLTVSEHTVESPVPLEALSNDGSPRVAKVEAQLSSESSVRRPPGDVVGMAVARMVGTVPPEAEQEQRAVETREEEEVGTEAGDAAARPATAHGSDLVTRGVAAHPSFEDAQEMELGRTRSGFVDEANEDAYVWSTVAAGAVAGRSSGAASPHREEECRERGPTSSLELHGVNAPVVSWSPEFPPGAAPQQPALERLEPLPTLQQLDGPLSAVAHGTQEPLLLSVAEHQHEQQQHPSSSTAGAVNGTMHSGSEALALNLPESAASVQTSVEAPSVNASLTSSTTYEITDVRYAETVHSASTGSPAPDSLERSTAVEAPLPVTGCPGGGTIIDLGLITEVAASAAALQCVMSRDATASGAELEMSSLEGASAVMGPTVTVAVEQSLTALEEVQTETLHDEEPAEPRVNEVDGWAGAAASEAMSTALLPPLPLPAADESEALMPEEEVEALATAGAMTDVQPAPLGPTATSLHVLATPMMRSVEEDGVADGVTAAPLSHVDVDAREALSEVPAVVAGSLVCTTSKGPFLEAAAGAAEIVGNSVMAVGAVSEAAVVPGAWAEVDVEAMKEAEVVEELHEAAELHTRGALSVGRSVIDAVQRDSLAMQRDSGVVHLPLPSALVAVGGGPSVNISCSTGGAAPLNMSHWLTGGDGVCAAPAAAASSATASAELLPAQSGWMPKDILPSYDDWELQPPPQPPGPPCYTAPDRNPSGAFRDLFLEFGEPDADPPREAAVTVTATATVVPPPPSTARIPSLPHAVSASTTTTLGTAVAHAQRVTPTTTSEPGAVASVAAAAATTAAAAAPTATIVRAKTGAVTQITSVPAPAPPAPPAQPVPPASSVRILSPTVAAQQVPAADAEHPSLLPLAPPAPPSSTATDSRESPSMTIDLLLATYGTIADSYSLTDKPSRANALTSTAPPPLALPAIVAAAGSGFIAPPSVAHGGGVGLDIGPMRAERNEEEEEEEEEDQLDLLEVFGDDVPAHISRMPSMPLPSSPPPTQQSSALLPQVQQPPSGAPSAAATAADLLLEGGYQRLGALEPTAMSSLSSQQGSSDQSNAAAAAAAATIRAPQASLFVPSPPSPAASGPSTAVPASAAAAAEAAAREGVHLSHLYGERGPAVTSISDKVPKDGGGGEGALDGNDGEEVAALEQRGAQPHEVALLRAEQLEAALLAGPSVFLDVLAPRGTSPGSEPSPIALMLASAQHPTPGPPHPPSQTFGPVSGSGGGSSGGSGGAKAASTLLEPLSGLTALLADASQDWNPCGRPDASGAMVGGSVALRLEEMHWALPDITQHWLTAGRPRVVTIFGSIVAVGTSLGAALVFQIPPDAGSGAATGAGGGAGAATQSAGPGREGAQLRSQYSGGHGGGVTTSSSGTAEHAVATTLPFGPGGGGSGSGGGGGGAIVVVGDARSEAEAVTAMALSSAVGSGDPLWLLVGHASGHVAAWDLQRRPPKMVAVISGQHDLPVVHVSFFPGRGASMALSADRLGNLLLHTFTHIVLKTAVASRIVLGGNMGHIGSIVHLTPFFAASTASCAPPLPADTATPQGRVGGTAAGGPAISAALVPPGARVGDGMVALCATTGCHIGRFKLSGELIPLYSIPRPNTVPTPCIPCAAWLPHHRRSTRLPTVVAAAAVTATDTSIAAASGAGVTSSVCAVLAVGWHDEVMFVDVPLVGDHSSPAALAVVPPPVSEAASLVNAPPSAVAAVQSGPQKADSQVAAPPPPPQSGQARRSFLRAAAAFTGVARGAATAAVAAAANAAAAASAATTTALAAATAATSSTAALDAQSAAALAQRLPLTVNRIWNATSAVLAAERSTPGSRTGDGAGLGGPGADDVTVRVVGLHWYDSDALGIVLLLGLAMRLVVVDLELEVREQVDCIDTPYTTGLMPPVSRGGAPAVPDTLCGSGARVILLGSSSTLYCSRLLTWQERLRTLADIGKWKLGMRFALDFYKLHLDRAAAAAAASTQPGPLRAQVAGPASSSSSSSLSSTTAAADASYPSALRGWLASLAVGFVKSALGAALREATRQGLRQLQLDQLSPSVVRQLRESAATAVLACLVAGREQLLFDTVFPLCRDAGALGPLIEAVEVAVLAGCLPRPAPELVQALVEHLAVGLRRPDRVERCVLHFDIASLDLNQVLRLCEAHQLLSASTAIYNRLHDYKRPLLDMLAAAAGIEPDTSASGRPMPQRLPASIIGSGHADRSSQAGDLENRKRSAGFKLLVYLRCIFRRQAFPPGMGSLPEVIPGAGRHGAPGGPDDVKAQLLGLLLFLEPGDLAREWRTPREHLPPRLLAGPHPALQVLLSVDVAAAVSVLGAAVAGWDAVETELREAAGRTAEEELDSVLVATQVLVNAFIHLLESDDTSIVNSPLSTSTSSSSSASDVVLDFIAGLLAAGRVVVRPAFGLLLLRHIAGRAVILLAAEEGGSCQAEAGGSLPDVTVAEPRPAAAATGAPAVTATSGPATGPALALRADLEVLFERLVAAVGVTAEGSRFNPDKMSVQETEEALQLARTASFPRALATLHHLRGDYQEALACHLRLPPPPSLLRGHPLDTAVDTAAGGMRVGSNKVAEAAAAGPASSAFAYVRGFLGAGSGATVAQRTAMYDALLAMAPELVSANPDATAQLLLEHYPGETQAGAFLEQLGGNKRLQYNFLTAAVQLKLALSRDVGGGGGHDDADGAHLTALQRQPSPYSAAASLHPAPAVALATLGTWLAQPTVANTYVQLLCEFEPYAVLPFLQRHHEYDVRHCISLCGAAGVWDAKAYLHERLGEWGEALRLHLRNVKRRNRDLNDAVLSGAVPSYYTGHSVGCVFFDHLAWLLQLSPRLALIMQSSLGRPAAEEAERAREGQPPHPHPHPSQISQPHNFIAHEVGLRLSRAPRTVAAVAAEVVAVEASSASPPESLGTAPAVAASPGVAASAASVQCVPPAELVRSWEALCRALAFCGRCFKQQQATQQAQAAQQQLQQQQQKAEAHWSLLQSGRDMDAASPASDYNTAPSHCWYSLLHAYVGEVQRRRMTTRRSMGRVVTSRASRALVLDVDVEELDAEQEEEAEDEEEVVGVVVAVRAAAGDAAAAGKCGRRVLRHVFGVLLEEVISRMSDYVPPSEVVRHIISTYGNQDFGGFRSTLLGLLGSCAYEQAIMSSAQRLISRGVFAAHKQRRLLMAGCLPGTAVHAMKEPEEGPDGARTMAVPRAAADELPSATARAAATTAATTTTAATAAATAATSVNAAAVPFWRLNDSSSTSGLAPVSSVAGAGSIGGVFTASTFTAVAGVALPLAPAGDVRAVRADSRFLAAMQAAVTLAADEGLTHGSVSRLVVARGRIQVAGSGRRPAMGPLWPAAGTAAATGLAGAGGGGLGRGLDVDELLSWTRALTG